MPSLICVNWTTCLFVYCSKLYFEYLLTCTFLLLGSFAILRYNNDIAKFSMCLLLLLGCGRFPNLSISPPWTSVLTVLASLTCPVNETAVWLSTHIALAACFLWIFLRQRHPETCKLKLQGENYFLKSFFDSMSHTTGALLQDFRFVVSQLRWSGVYSRPHEWRWVGV